MTINSTSSAVTLQGNGATNTWPYAFKIPGASATDQTFVVVTVVDTTVTPAVITVLAANQYAITGVNTPAGGNVTYPLSGANPPVGVFVTIQRAVTAVQITAIPNQSAFLPVVVEAALDYLTMLAQQILTAQTRSLQAAVSDSGGVPAAIPDASVRKNMAAVWDASGNLTAGAQANVVVNAAMVGLVQAVSLAAARSFLASGVVGDALFTAATKAAALGTLGILTDPQTFTAAMTLKSTTAGAGVETFLTLLRNKGAGAVNDVLERLAFDGMNAATVQKTFAGLHAHIVTAAAGAEDGALHLQTIQGGALADVALLFKGMILGGPAGGDKGVGTLNAAAGLYDAGVRVLPSPFAVAVEYAPADQTITSGGIVALAHGFGIRPKCVVVTLINQIAELGYVPTQEVDALTAPGYNGSVRGLSVIRDVSNITVRIGNDAAPLYLLNVAGTAISGITPANWKLRVRAYA